MTLASILWAALPLLPACALACGLLYIAAPRRGDTRTAAERGIDALSGLAHWLWHVSLAWRAGLERYRELRRER